MHEDLTVTHEHEEEAEHSRICALMLVISFGLKINQVHCSFASRLYLNG